MESGIGHDFLDVADGSRSDRVGYRDSIGGRSGLVMGRGVRSSTLGLDCLVGHARAESFVLDIVGMGSLSMIWGSRGLRRGWV